MNIFYIIGVIVVVLFVAGCTLERNIWRTCEIMNSSRGFKHGERERCADRIGENDRQIVFQNA